MLKHLRDALIEKIEEQRPSSTYCTIQWKANGAIEVISQRLLSLPSLENPEVNATYTIYINDSKCYGTVLAVGTREYCEQFARDHSSRKERCAAEGCHVMKSANLLDDLFLAGILAKLLNKGHSNDVTDEVDVHDAQCSACGVTPIRNTDRYHCLECVSPTYDLCGSCFENRRRTGAHQSGHAMVHFKIPYEILGLYFNDVDRQVTLNYLKRLDTLRFEQHERINCDGVCKQKNFIGLRFKCDTCPNYNLCEKCAIERRVCTKNHQKDHPIILTSEKVIPQVDPDDIELGEVLGSGGFGYVCKATWRTKKRSIACKIIEVVDNSAESDTFERSFLHELAAYRELSGRYILRSYGYATRKLSASRTQPAKTQYMILMELMPRGSLQHLLAKHPNQLSLRRKLSMSRQIAAGMRRIHEHGMIHRDIRPDNILVTEDYVAKIGDMGIARVLKRGASQTQIGCIDFMPPEFFRNADAGRVVYDEKLDIYTFGLTLNQLFTETLHQVFFKPLPEVKLLKKSPIFYDEIIARCLENDPQRRPAATEIEKVFQFYENAFNDTMLSDSYQKLTTKQKDEAFIDFYNKNKSNIQRFIHDKFPQEFKRNIPVRVVKQEEQFSSSNPTLIDTCRVN